MSIDNKELTPPWVTKGKTIRGLIQELMSFEDQDLKVFISVDKGKTLRLISTVKKQINNKGEEFEGPCCVLANYEGD